MLVKMNLKRKTWTASSTDWSCYSLILLTPTTITLLRRFLPQEQSTVGAKKGEAGAVIEGDEGATMQYVSWQNAPESVKLEIETLLRMIYTLTQTPDISFESVKGLEAISGIALKLLFMDAHLKVQDKREIFDEYLQRRANIIKAYIGDFNHQLKETCENMEIEPEITPYMLTNELDELTYWLTANGGKAVISQEEAVEKIGISKNPKATYEKLKEEENRNNSFMISEPVEA
ncbi:phage portal protein [Capnocytophaga canimorsus]|nr:phage portal protein [Capnocytophaga canimorsus]WGU68247.1 phage portal protein [Capnocytophaga canimorsus]